MKATQQSSLQVIIHYYSVLARPKLISFWESLTIKCLAHVIGALTLIRYFSTIVTEKFERNSMENEGWMSQSSPVFVGTLCSLLLPNPHSLTLPRLKCNWCRIWSNDPIRIKCSKLSENLNSVLSSWPWATVPADLSHVWVWTRKETLQRLG